MLKLENSIRGLSFSRVAFDLTIQDIENHPGLIFLYATKNILHEQQKFHHYHTIL